MSLGAIRDVFSYYYNYNAYQAAAWGTAAANEWSPGFSTCYAHALACRVIFSTRMRTVNR